MKTKKITMERKKISLEDAIDIITDGNISDLSELSVDKKEDNINMLPKISIEESRNSDTDDDIPLTAIASTSTDNNKGNLEPAIKHIYQWRKNDTLVSQREFRGKFSEPPQTEITPYDYFIMFITPEIIDCIVEQRNLYSFQKSQKSINTNVSEFSSLIGIFIKMGVVLLLSYYWARELRYSPIADVMGRNCFQQLLQCLHFVNNNNINKNDKLAKIKTIIEAVRNQCVKFEPKEFHSINEQTIPLKTKFSSIC